MLNLENKTALVLGGLGGIGSEIVCSFLFCRIGKLAVIDIVDDAKSALGDFLGDVIFRYRKASVDDHASLKRAMEELSKELGGFDIIVNSASVFRESDPALNIAVNYGGVVNSTLIGLELMRKDKEGNGGIIINRASVAALSHSFVCPIFCGAKTAILAFTKSLANEAFYAKTGVSFVTICEGLTKTRHGLRIADYISNALFPEMIEEIEKEALKYPPQYGSEVAECVLEAIKEGENGSVWQAENGRVEKIQLHEYPIF